MKKIILIIFIKRFIFSSAFAEVYYCSDDANKGFRHDSNQDYVSANFKVQRFKAKIDFEEKTMMADKIFTGRNNCTLGGTYDEFKTYMVCTDDYGSILKIQKLSLIFYRAATFGGGDTLHIAHGRCEKF